MENYQYTVEELREFILYNVTHYKDFEEYEKYNNVDAEEFKDKVAVGFIQDITCGTYNGATQTFTPWELNDGNLIDTIIQDIREGILYESLEDFVEGARYIDYALAYVELYKVFTLEGKVYVDMD